MDQLSCRDDDRGRLLIHASATASSEGGSRAWHVVENTFQLMQGTFVVVETREFTTSSEQSFLSGEQLCGSNLGGDVIDG
jgi:hypothetical protein